MSRFWVLGLTLLLGLPATPAQARIEALSFDSPAQEARYQKLIAELRCLVCQNQNLQDSNADLAKDLREITYNMIKQGASDTEIMNYMVERYGDFVLYRPPMRSSTVLLWVGPFLLLAGGIAVLIVVVRRRAGNQPQALAESDRSRVRQLLDDEPEKSGGQ